MELGSQEDSDNLSSEEENQDAANVNEIEVLLAEDQGNAQQNCMMTKAMWVIENMDKTEGKPIELSKPFRLLSLAN